MSAKGRQENRGSTSCVLIGRALCGKLRSLELIRFETFIDEIANRRSTPVNPDNLNPPLGTNLDNSAALGNNASRRW